MQGRIFSDEGERKTAEIFQVSEKARFQTVSENAVYARDPVLSEIFFQKNLPLQTYLFAVYAGGDQ